MALSELQVWILHEVAAKGGTLQAMPMHPGITTEDMEQAIDGLCQRRYVEVIGPPNQNSGLGKDVDELRLLPYGVDYLRTLR